MHLSPAELAISLAAVLVGAIVQGSVGFGLNLVAVPVVAVIEPAALPATLVLVALPLALGMVLREHDAVDRAGLAWMLLGRVPGTVLGAWVVTALPDDGLSVAIGVVVLVAVATSLLVPPVSVRPSTAVTAGLASGAMGTATSIGGPPIALLYQHHDGPVLRSTSAAMFTAGTALSIAALAVAGQVTRDHLLLALALVPGVVVGSVVAQRLQGRLDARWLRPAVLIFAVLAAIVTVQRGLA